MGMVKKFLRSIFFRLSPIFRSRSSLGIIKKIPNGRTKQWLVHVLDPNNVRKNRKFVYSEKLTLVRCNGIKMMVDLNDHIGFKYFLDHKFDQDIILIGRLMNFSKKDILLDIGANIGSVSIPFAKQFGCRIILVEASYHNASLLCRNIGINKIKAHLIIGAASNYTRTPENEFTKLYLSYGNLGATSIDQDWNVGKLEKDYEYTPSLKLDDVIDDFYLARIRIIKIDIEGYEYHALSGFNNIFKLEALLIFEFRYDLLRHSDQNPLKVINLISKHFQIFNFSFINEKIKLTRFDPHIPQKNLLAIPNSKIEFYLKMFN
jgi:FkbM family methyltransferase